MQHRPAQPYPGAAPLHPGQQLRAVNSTQAEQQSYPVQNVYNPQTGLQSPFLGNQLQYQSQQPTPETTFYASNPSPRSQHSAPGPYRPAEKSEPMAATATMNRPYPQIYNTPNSNSPASVTSPQSHDHGRPMYNQPGPQLYGYPQYQSMSQVHQPAYGQHPGQQQQQHQMSNPSMLSYQQNSQQLPQGQVTSHHSAISSSPRLKTEPNQQYQHTPQNRAAIMQPQHPSSAPPSASLQPQQPGSNASSNAAPGPIPATTPLVVRQDGNGVQWIAFEYSRDRVKMEYTIRCDVESVDANALSQEFKSENCVYPRACVPKEQYKGNRLAYETDCNQVGWALAELNPCLRGKRGLIQRAVDSWRNSNQDPRLRSRRVRRQAKMTNRSKQSASTAAAAQTPGSNGPGSAGLPGSNSMPAPSARPPGPMSTGSQQIHHRHADGSPQGQDNLGPSGYPSAPQQYRQNSSSQHMGSPNDLRQAHVFPGYQTYPSAPTTLGPSMTPSMQGGLHQLGRPGGTAAMASKDMDDKDDEDTALFGDIPEGKRRKFILVEDTQKNARVRVKVTLDQIEVSEIPDSYRKQNSVFPRAYYPVQMQTGQGSSRGNRFSVDEGDEVDGGFATLGRTSVPVQTSDGEAEVEVPQISRSKRGREQKINELGYRMAWGQGRVFSGRPIFLARALDAYRNKQRSALVAAGQEVTAIPSHLETRAGKRRWLERTRTVIHPNTPPAAVSD